MIPQVHDRQVTSSGDQPAMSFSISMKDSAHLMTILRDTLYSDKVSAVLREYGANAKDAHAESGQKDRPIEVKVPTPMEPTLEIRDYGSGLSHEQVFSVFSQYGASTKRDSNDSIGYLGIGSKSGFAYSDSFTIISRNGGMCRTYVAVLDASEQGEICLLDETPCGDETGLTIQIGVRPYDIDEFRVKAAKVFRFYSPRPIINIELPPAITESAVIPGEETWLAVMGGVAYEVDLSQVRVTEYIRGCGGVVFFNIGDLRVSASRESLKYDDHTKRNLAAALHDTLDSWVTRYSSTIAGLTQWAKRVQLQGMGLFGKLLATVTFPGAFDNRVDIRDIKTPSIRYKFGSVSVDKDTRFVFVDDRRSIKGFSLKDGQDYVVRRAPEHTVAEAWDGLQALIKKLNIVGVPVVRTSELPWTKPTKSATNSKHNETTFVFLDGTVCKPLSNLWEAVDREEDEDDVYVVLDSFKTDMYDQFRVDRRILEVFGLTPTIYGYKKSRNGDNVHAGTTYAEWRTGLYDMVVEKDPKVDDLIAALGWQRWIPCNRFGYSHHKDQYKEGIKALGRLIEALGDQHPISLVADKIRLAAQLLSQTTLAKIDAVGTLQGRLNRRSDAVPAELTAIYNNYPLTSGNFSLLLDSGAEHWIEYAKALDFHRTHEQAKKEG